MNGYVFNRMDKEANEPVDASVIALKKLAKAWNYGTMIEL